MQCSFHFGKRFEDPVTLTGHNVCRSDKSKAKEIVICLWHSNASACRTKFTNKPSFHINTIVRYGVTTMSLQLYDKLQKEFLMCDNCFWTASAVSFRLLDIRHCPKCDSSLSRIPLGPSESFTVSYNDKRGIELAFT